jgi:hypothetical protein
VFYYSVELFCLILLDYSVRFSLENVSDDFFFHFFQKRNFF